jgi:hypothetical protein
MKYYRWIDSSKKSIAIYAPSMMASNFPHNEWLCCATLENDIYLIGHLLVLGYIPEYVFYSLNAAKEQCDLLLQYNGYKKLPDRLEILL